MQMLCEREEPHKEKGGTWSWPGDCVMQLQLSVWMIVTNTMKWDLLGVDMLIKQQTAGYLAALRGGGKRGFFHLCLAFAIPLPSSSINLLYHPQKIKVHCQKEAFGQKTAQASETKDQTSPTRFLEPSPAFPTPPQVSSAFIPLVLPGDLPSLCLVSALPYCYNSIILLPSRPVLPLAVAPTF